MSYSLTCGPVVDVPVIAWFINQSVVLLQLILIHCVQVSLCKKAEREMEKIFNFFPKMFKSWQVIYLRSW